MARLAVLLPFPDRSGRIPVPAAGLAARLDALGLAAARAYQGNNLLLDPGERPESEVAALVADAALAGWGVRPAVILRRGEEMRDILARVPFPPDASPSRVSITFLAGDPDPAGVRTLETYRGPEPVCVSGREVYVLYGEDVARSPYTNLPLERLLGTPVAARTLHSVRALAILAGA